MAKSVFITGASSGLGKASALLFASKGWDVIATMRKPELEKELTHFPNIQVFKLDVTNLIEIEDLVKTISSNKTPDVVFNNAGYGLAGPLEGTTDEQIQDELNTNLLGVIRITKAFIPYFRERGSGLFITTTSIGGLVTFPFNSIYHATKWALEGWSESMSFELSPYGIGIKTVSPGGISTDFAGRSLVLTHHPAYSKEIEKVMKVFMDPERAQNASTADQIAEIVFEAATNGKDILRYLAGNDAKAAFQRRNKIGAEAFRMEIGKQFLG